MRKLLLATTALAGAALFAGAAQANQGMEVTVGGYNDFRAGFMGEDLTAGPGVARRKNDFENEYALDVEAKAKAGNGMEYGAVATLWNGADTNNVPGNNNIHLHNAYGYVNGAWGQVRLGDHHGVSDFHVEAPLSYSFGGQVDGYYTEFVSGAVNAIGPHFVDDIDASTRVTYMTPKFGMDGHKVQAGVSYAPNDYEPGQAVTGVTGGTGYKNEVKVGAQYEGSFMNKVSALVGATLQTADADNGATLTGLAKKDYTAWDVGAQLGYAGFTVGGNYAGGGRYGTVDGQNNGQHAWTIGAGYKFDRASFAGSYLSGRGYNNNAGTRTSAAFVNTDTNYSRLTAWGLGAGYSLFDGMTTSVDTLFFKQEAPTGGLSADEGHVVILSNRVAF